MRDSIHNVYIMCCLNKVLRRGLFASAVLIDQVTELTSCRRIFVPRARLISGSISCENAIYQCRPSFLPKNAGVAGRRSNRLGVWQAEDAPSLQSYAGIWMPAYPWAAHAEVVLEYHTSSAVGLMRGGVTRSAVQFAFFRKVAERDLYAGFAPVMDASEAVRAQNCSHRLFSFIIKHFTHNMLFRDCETSCCVLTINIRGCQTFKPRSYINDKEMRPMRKHVLTVIYVRRTTHKKGSRLLWNATITRETRRRVR